MKQNNLPTADQMQRHTAATLAIQSGADLATVQFLLRNPDHKTTLSIYVGGSEEVKPKAVDQTLADAMEHHRHCFTEQRARRLLNFGGYTMRARRKGTFNEWPFKITETATGKVVLGADGQATFDDLCDFIRAHDLDRLYRDELRERQHDRARERRR